MKNVNTRVLFTSSHVSVKREPTGLREEGLRHAIHSCRTDRLFITGSVFDQVNVAEVTTAGLF